MSLLSFVTFFIHLGISGDEEQLAFKLQEQHGFLWCYNVSCLLLIVTSTLYAFSECC